MRYHEVSVGTAQGDELPDHDRLWEQVENTYNNTCVALNRLLLQCKASSHPPATTESAQSSKTTTCDIKLDPVSIETLVHDADFPEVYKLSKLRQAVSASVVPLIGGLYSGGQL